MFKKILHRAALSIGSRLVRFGLSSPGNSVASTSQTGDQTEAHAKRVQQELERYRTVENVHDLPDIFHFWSLKYIRPKLESVFGVSTINDFYAKYIFEFQSAHPGRTVRIASLGAGNCDMEVEIADLLRNRDLTDFRLFCLDMNRDMLDRGEKLASENGLADHFECVETDIARWNPQQEMAVVIAHHFLHHIVDLEGVFANIRKAIGDEGYLVTCDMIGRNGHMRWPEALGIIQDIWRTMPDRYKYNHQLNRFEEKYEN